MKGVGVACQTGGRKGAGFAGASGMTGTSWSASCGMGVEDGVMSDDEEDWRGAGRM